MSFTKLSYDDCSYKANLAGNVSQMGYIFDPVRYYNCSKCRNENGLVGGTAVSHVNGNLVDLESNLFGIDREASKCSVMKYIPNPKEAIGADHYRKINTNKVDTEMQHLPPCQMHSVKGIPHPPAYEPYTCPL
jgi:hypothetical protein